MAFLHENRKAAHESLSLLSADKFDHNSHHHHTIDASNAFESKHRSGVDHDNAITTTNRAFTFMMMLKVAIALMLSFCILGIVSEMASLVPSSTFRHRWRNRHRHESTNVEMACFVMINESDLEIRALNTLQGWGYACTHFVFFTGATEGHHHQDLIVNRADTTYGQTQQIHARVVDILDSADDVYDKVGRKSWLCWPTSRFR